MTFGFTLFILMPYYPLIEPRQGTYGFIIKQIPHSVWNDRIRPTGRKEVLQKD